MVIFCRSAKLDLRSPIVFRSRTQFELRVLLFEHQTLVHLDFGYTLEEIGKVGRECLYQEESVRGSENVAVVFFCRVEGFEKREALGEGVFA